MLVYGGWAAFCNFPHGIAAAGIAFAIQGGFAFSSTWVLGKLLHVSHHFYAHRDWAINHLRKLIFANCSAFLVGVPAVLHWLASTPNALWAMLPGLVVGHGYLGVLVSQYPKQ
jgi:hypothetical protein